MFWCMVPQITPRAVDLRKDIELGFEVHIEYGDMAQQQRLLTVIYLLPLHNRVELHMQRLDLYECDENWAPERSPIACTGALPVEFGELPVE